MHMFQARSFCTILCCVLYAEELSHLFRLWYDSSDSLIEIDTYGYFRMVSHDTALMDTCCGKW